MGRVTIKSIANDLGISHMTVSRALSGHPNVLPETREAVQRRARELGYVKSAAAMAMRGDAPRIVGLLLPNIVNEFYARFANRMAEACDAQSRQLIIHLTNDDLDAEAQALARLREVQASAVVMVPAPGQPDAPEPAPGAMRVVELIRRRSGNNPVIHVEDGPAIRAGVRHLAAQGHRRIAYIGADRALSSGSSRLASFIAGTEAAGLDVAEELILTGAPSFEMGQANAHMILSSRAATALLCGGFEISNGALSACMETAASRDHRLAFVGYGDPSFYAWVNGGLSTIEVPLTQLADRAVELVTAEDMHAVPERISFEAGLVVRSGSPL